MWRGVGDGGTGVVGQGEVGSSAKAAFGYSLVLGVGPCQFAIAASYREMAAQANTLSRSDSFLDAAIETESHI